YPAEAGVKRPAAIVVRRPAPRLVGDPHQAVVRAMVPVAVVVRPPAGGDMRAPAPAAHAVDVHPGAVIGQVGLGIADGRNDVAGRGVIPFGTVDEPPLEVVTTAAGKTHEAVQPLIVDARFFTRPDAEGLLRRAHL